MNQSQVISSFFRIAANNKKLGTTHFALFLAMLECWNEQQWNAPFLISRSKLMSLSKIQSSSTYHICMNDLKHFGVISYKPSYHPGKRTELIFFLKE